MDKSNAISYAEKIEADNLEIQEFFTSKGKLSESNLLYPIKKNINTQKNDKINLIDISMNFLEFKEFRVKKGYTQEKMGLLLGVDKMIITQFEKNGCLPTLAANIIDAILASEFIKKESKLKGLRKLKTGPIEPDLFTTTNRKNIRGKKYNLSTIEPNSCSENLQKYRKLMGYSQEYVADHLGVNRRTIINWEQGKAIPKSRLFYLDKLIKEWKVELSQLVGSEKSNETRIGHESINHKKPIEEVETNITLESKYIALLEEQIELLKARLSKYE